MEQNLFKFLTTLKSLIKKLNHLNYIKWHKNCTNLLKELRNHIGKNYFCVRHKNRRTHNQHFKLLFFELNSHLSPSN